MAVFYFRDAYGVVRPSDTTEVFYVRDCYGVALPSTTLPIYIRDAYGNVVLSNSSPLYIRDDNGVVVDASLAAPTVIDARGVRTVAEVGTFEAAFGGYYPGSAGVVLPVNTGLPTITGDLIQGGSVIFTPGTWDGSYFIDYRVLRGNVSAPTAPVDVLLDWTTDTSTLISPIADGDYLWLQERASGLTIATSAAGHGPMVALTPADASVVQVGGLGTNTATAATTYTFNMTLTAQPAAGFLLCLANSGLNDVAVPSWSSVTIAGIPLTQIKTWSGADESGSGMLLCEVWGIWGTSIPSGTVTISATRSASTQAHRSSLVAYHIANTQAGLPALGDVDVLSSITDASTYAFTGTTSVDKTLVIGFPFGVAKTVTAALPTISPVSMTVGMQPWPGARPTTTSHWGGGMSLAVATAGSYNAGFDWVDGANQCRRVAVPLVRIHGDNS